MIAASTCRAFTDPDGARLPASIGDRRQHIDPAIGHRENAGITGREYNAVVGIVGGSPAGKRIDGRSLLHHDAIATRDQDNVCAGEDSAATHRRAPSAGFEGRHSSRIGQAELTADQEARRAERIELSGTNGGARETGRGTLALAENLDVESRERDRAAITNAVGSRREQCAAVELQQRRIGALPRIAKSQHKVMGIRKDLAANAATPC